MYRYTGELLRAIASIYYSMGDSPDSLEYRADFDLALSKLGDKARGLIKRDIKGMVSKRSLKALKEVYNVMARGLNGQE